MTHLHSFLSCGISALLELCGETMETHPGPALSIKGALSWDFSQVNSVLKSLFSTFTRTQNAPAELRRKYQMKFSRERKP